MNNDQAEGGVLSIGLLDGTFSFFKATKPGTLVHFLNLRIGDRKEVYAMAKRSAVSRWLWDHWRVRTISLPLKGELQALPTYFHDGGREYVAFGLSDKHFYLVNLGDLGNPIKINVGENLVAPPVFRRFDTRNGFLSLRGESGTTYLVDLRAPGTPVEIPRASNLDYYGFPQPFTALSGDRLRAFHDRGDLNITGLEKPKYSYIGDLRDRTQTLLRHPFYHRTHAGEEFIGLWTGKSYFLKDLNDDRVFKIDLQPFATDPNLEPVFYSLKSGKAYIILTDNRNHELKFIDIETGALRAKVNMGLEIAFPPQPYISGDDDERLLVTLRDNQTPNSHYTVILRMFSTPEQKDLN